MNSAEYFEEEYQRQMYRRIDCLPILLLCVVLSFVGCKTIRESEIVEIHDTVTTHRIDTVREYKLKTLYDTVHYWHTETITLSDSGDTIKQIVNNYFKERIIEKDSTDKYKSSIDSLKAVLNQLHDKQTVVEKKPSWWQMWKWKIVALAAIILAAFLVIRDIAPRVRNILQRKTDIH